MTSCSEAEADSRIDSPIYLVISAKALGEICINHASRAQIVVAAQCNFHPGILKAERGALACLSGFSEQDMAVSVKFVEQIYLSIEIAFVTFYSGNYTQASD